MNAIVGWDFIDYIGKLNCLCDRLNIDKCYYYYGSENEIIKNNDRFIGLYLYDPIESYIAKSNNLQPLDDAIIRAMKEYELTAFDILNRWRRSLTTKESYMSLRQIYFEYLYYWNDFILKNNIGLFFLTYEPHIAMTYFPYALCKIYDIPIILAGTLPVIKGRKMNYCLKCDLENNDKSFMIRYEKNKQQYSQKNIDVELPSNLEMYFQEYIKPDKEVKRVIVSNEKFNLFKSVSRYVSRGLIYIKQNRINILSKKIIYLVKMRFISKRILRYAEKLEEMPINSEKYFIFFLHLQPECTTLPRGGVYVDQMLIIKLLSQLLPKDYYLYVKEHPAFWLMKGRWEGVQESRNIEFYNEIKKMKNVRLIDHNENSISLLQKAVCVVTVTGTVGFEALFYGKPVLVFGKAVYSQCEKVFNVRNYDQCSEAIEDIIDNKWKKDERALKVFLKTLEPNIISCGHWEKRALDNGFPELTEKDMESYIKKVETFYRVNYEE